MRIKATAAAIFVALVPASVNAHSGSTILAERVGSAADLETDFAAQCERLTQFDPALAVPSGPEDIGACFRVGYDEANRALFVLAEISDDIVVSERADTALPNGLGNNPDGAMLYFDFGHRATFAEKMEFSLVERPIAAVDDRLLPDGAVSIRRDALAHGQTRYLWRIDLEMIWEDQQMDPQWLASGALVFGFDLVVFDRDAEEDGAILKWTSGANDGAENRDLGDLVIWPEEAEWVEARGNTQWPEAADEVEPPRFAHFRSASFPHVMFRSLTGQGGDFALDLPAGDYLAFASDSRSVLDLADGRPVTIAAGETSGIPTLTGPSPSNDLLGWLSLLAEEHGVRTLGIGYAHEGELRFVRALGTNANGTAAGDDTVFRTASITKLITTMTVLAMVAEGNWDLDAPLAEHFVAPELADDPRYAQLTTRMVLRHLTGLPNWRMDEQLTFLHAPGETQGYSGEAFELLRQALETHSGESLDTLARRHVFEPAGMEQTSFRWSPFVADRFAGEYWGTGAAIPHYRGDSVNAAANMLSTPSDLLRFGLWFLEWREAHPELAASLQQPNSADLMPADRPGLAPHGLGWIVHDRDERLLLEHSGGQRGINTHLLVVPETQSVLVVLTNSSAGWPLVRAAFQGTINADRSMPEALESLYGDIRF